MPKPLRFEDLAERQDIDPHQLQGYANAAKVRLEAHHTPPVDFEVTSKGETVVYELKRAPCDDKLRRSYNNSDDAKRDGAYIMAFAAVEDPEGMVSIARARDQDRRRLVRGPCRHEPSRLGECVSPGVSGTDGTPSEARQRLKEKQEDRKSVV